MDEQDLKPIAPLMSLLGDYMIAPQLKAVQDAYEVAKTAHGPQTRASGEPYIYHPIAVAMILANMRMDLPSIMAALLHDVAEDTSYGYKDIKRRFGKEVADLVEGVTKLTQMKFRSHQEAQAENFQKMVLAMVQDLRVIIIKLADRLHNMRTLDALSPTKQKRIAQETLEIFAPIALRLGMHAFHLEFEERGFYYVHPMRYRIIKKAIEKGGAEKKLLKKISDTMDAKLKAQNISEISVNGREKHLYSIYKKMQEKRIPLSEVLDVYGFRIIVKSVDDCYRALGVAHNLYKPVPGHFKDYIAIPKLNGYQSLHTNLFGPDGTPIELQIRTQDMHALAEDGVAAHWRYKAKESEIHPAQAKLRQWLENLLEIQKSSGTSLEFIENAKIDLYPDEVYIFTPKGKILELPSGSTPVDFAYAVHTDLGNMCVAAKVDRRYVPLSTRLRNGQTVQILTQSKAQPNPDWLNFVVTAKARSNIRHRLKHQKHHAATRLGKKLLDRELKLLASSLRKIPKDHLHTLLKTYRYHTIKELFYDIGIGNRMAILEAKRLAAFEATAPSLQMEMGGHHEALMIKGTEGSVLHFSTCCYPIPGDPIIGFLSEGHGIEVHTEECKKVSALKSHPDRLLSLRWNKDVRGEFKTKIYVEAEDAPGLLASIGNAIFQTNTNIEHVSMTERDGNCITFVIIITVRDRLHLADVIRQLKQLKSVLKIIRR